MGTGKCVGGTSGQIIRGVSCGDQQDRSSGRYGQDHYGATDLATSAELAPSRFAMR